MQMPKLSKGLPKLSKGQQKLKQLSDQRAMSMSAEAQAKQWEAGSQALARAEADYKREQEYEMRKAEERAQKAEESMRQWVKNNPMPPLVTTTTGPWSTTTTWDTTTTGTSYPSINIYPAPYTPAGTAQVYGQPYPVPAPDPPSLVHQYECPVHGPTHNWLSFGHSGSGWASQLLGTEAFCLDCLHEALVKLGLRPLKEWKP